MKQPAETAAAGAEPLAASVIIPARDEETTIAGCLQALAQQTLGPERIEVIVVASGHDRTAEVAAAERSGRFGGFEVIRLGEGNKNAALRAGCRRARTPVMVLLDADTELAPTAVGEMIAALGRQPDSVVHASLAPRRITWVSRYCELNRKLVKDLRFDGQLSGAVVALPRAALPPESLADLFPDRVGAADDLRLGRALQQRGWRIAYAPAAEATTLFPWTLRGLARSMLRNRRGVMAELPRSDGALQAARSAVLLASLLAALLGATRSAWLALVGAIPLLLHAAVLAWRVGMLRRRGLGDYRRGLPIYLGLDLLGRTLKLWAFVESVIGLQPPATFQGERPRSTTSSGAASEPPEH